MIIHLVEFQVSELVKNQAVFSKHFVVRVALPRVGVATDVPSHLGGVGKSPLPENVDFLFLADTFSSFLRYEKSNFK